MTVGPVKKILAKAAFHERQALRLRAKALQLQGRRERKVLSPPLRANLQHHLGLARYYRRVAEALEKALAKYGAEPSVEEITPARPRRGDERIHLRVTLGEAGAGPIGGVGPSSHETTLAAFTADNADDPDLVEEVRSLLPGAQYEGGGGGGVRFVIERLRRL